MAGKAFKILPKNYLSDWGEFDSWSLGAATNPDGWLYASNPLIAQEATFIKYGIYAARIIGSGAQGGLYRTIPNGAGTNFPGRTFSLGYWGKSASTGPYIELNDGVNSKTCHLDGLNAYSFFTTPAMKLDYASTQLRINLWASVGATAYYDSGVLCEGDTLFVNFDSSPPNNIDISDWSPTLNMKQDQYEIANREGSFTPEMHLQGQTINVKGQVTGSDVNSGSTAFNNLMRALLDWQQNQQRDLYLYDNRVITVFLKNASWSYKNGLQFIPFSLQFFCQDAVKRAISKYRYHAIISGTITEFNFTYNGNADSKPVISFIADQGAVISTCQLQNLTTLETMAYTGTVPTGVALDIDCLNGTVMNSSINNVSNFGASDFLRIVRGTNYFRFTGNPCTINIDYFERYFS